MNAQLIRQALLARQDGATAQELADELQRDNGSIYRVLPKMPDAYIDRWLDNPRNRGKSRYTAVWDVVRVPPNCPKPGR